MFILKTEASFDSAHFLSGHGGKCRNLHGHRWRIIVEIKSDTLNESGESEGMVVDFSDIKNDLKKEADFLDHSLIIQKNTLKDKTVEALKEEEFKIIEVEFRPTAENMSKYFYDKMKAKGYNIKGVTVYESPNNAATYEED